MNFRFYKFPGSPEFSQIQNFHFHMDTEISVYGHIGIYVNFHKQIYTYWHIRMDIYVHWQLNIELASLHSASLCSLGCFRILLSWCFFYLYPDIEICGNMGKYKERYRNMGKYREIERYRGIYTPSRARIRIEREIVKQTLN